MRSRCAARARARQDQKGSHTPIPHLVRNAVTGEPFSMGTSNPGERARARARRIFLRCVRGGKEVKEETNKKTTEITLGLSGNWDTC